MFRPAYSISRSTVGGVIMLGTAYAVMQLPNQGRKAEWYHWLADEWGTPLLRRFLSPEDAHNMALELCKRGWSPLYRPSVVEQRMNMSSTPFICKNSLVESKQQQPTVKDDPNQQQPQQGVLQFENPIGLAAGFDKDGTTIQPLLELGFGFVEIGSVTLQPQEGNPKPRMFRFPDDYAIINRYGFNSLGATFVEQQLKRYYRQLLSPEEQQKQQVEDKMLQQQQQQREEQKEGKEEEQEPTKRRPRLRSFRQNERHGIVGINLGMNKTSTTPLEDYQLLIRQLGPYADYIVINVSSPNTPGLRDLQQKESLHQLLSACLDARNRLRTSNTPSSSSSHYSYTNVPPLLVKLAPDLTDEELEEIAKVLLQVEVDGMILTNTTNQRPTSFMSVVDQPSGSSYNQKNELGGLSGRPLRDISTERIRTMYQLTNGQIPIIGVGGIMTAQDAYEKLKAGASLVQVYTGMVYEGPGLISRLRHDLAKLLLDHGHRQLDDVIGLDHPDIHWRKQQERANLILKTNET